MNRTIKYGGKFNYDPTEKEVQMSKPVRKCAVMGCAAQTRSTQGKCHDHRGLPTVTVTGEWISIAGACYRASIGRAIADRIVDELEQAGM